MEHYNGENGIIIPKTTQNDFQVIVFSFNIDYAITENLFWCLDYGNLNSKGEYFKEKY